MDERTLRRWKAKVEAVPGTACWPWLASKDQDGYGWFRDGLVKRAHRVAFEHFVAPIPDGMDVDHICRNPSCVNPEHLQTITRKENVLRGIGVTARNKRRTHCPRGHPYSPENTYTNKTRGYRTCKTCRALASRVRRAGPTSSLHR